MTTKKTNETHDIATSNRLIENLKPILFFEEEMTKFIEARSFDEAAKIKDTPLRLATLSFIYFCVSKTQDGIAYAEEALALSPDDMITWKHYMLCVFWRKGPICALEVAKRALKSVMSIEICRNAMFYALQSGDYDFMLEMFDTLSKTNKLEELVTAQREVSLMQQGISYAKLIKNANKAETIKSLTALMYQKLDLEQKMGAFPQIIDLSDEDGQSYLFELFVYNSDSKVCGKLNLELISERVELGLTDWEVGCMFVSERKEIVLNARYT